jgi:hypothetical protein
MNIRRVPTSKGLRSILTYWYRGVRYRPVLGLNLSTDQEREAALQVISAIHANTSTGGIDPGSPASREIQTFEDFLSTYFQYLKAKHRDADNRNELAIRLHLLPFFGPKLLSEIRLEDGLAYLETRRSEEAAEGTIERECGVLMAILNLAVDFEVLDRNRLRRLPVPKASMRERVLDPSELLLLRQAASEPVWRALMADLQTGLRANKLIETHVEWVVQKADGYWLYPSPGRTTIKGVPKALPLNRLALDALYGQQKRIAGRFFEQWKDAGSFKHRWEEPSNEAA